MTDGVADVLMPQVSLEKSSSVTLNLSVINVVIYIGWSGCWVEFGKGRWCNEAEAVMEGKIFHQRVGILQDSS